MKYDVESPEYGENMLEWLNSLESLNDSEPHKLGRIYHAFVVNLFPLKGLTVIITEVNGKRAIIFMYQAEYKVYYPTKIEVSMRDYDENNGRAITVARVDDLFWAYMECFSHLPMYQGGVLINFGMDMTMPFLEQQDFKLLD